MSGDGSKKQFWKRNTSKVPGNIQHVYGAQHPPFDPLLHANLMKAGNKPPSTTTPGKPKKATTFQEFESITSDAWDVGDDDDELLAMAAQNLNIEVVMETANKVIENHSNVSGVPSLSPGLQTFPDPIPPAVSGLYMIIKAVFSLLSEVGVEQAVLHRQHSLPHRPVIPLVARMADQNTSGTPAMTEREASRLDKFRQVLAGPNTDLGKIILLNLQPCSLEPTVLKRLFPACFSSPGLLCFK
uniref:TBC1 domain family member 22A-like n=1 Tax=Sinocyclocheilus rhinocerous TaxID=307959 RepID=A0A673HAM3_9TELE